MELEGSALPWETVPCQCNTLLTHTFQFTSMRAILTSGFHRLLNGRFMVELGTTIRFHDLGRLDHITTGSKDPFF
jgi:hypothetical protein